MNLRPTELLTLFDSKSNLFPLKENALAPIRITSDGRLCAEYQNSGYVLYRLPSDELAIFNDEVLDRSELKYPLEDVSLDAVPGIIEQHSGEYAAPKIQLISNQFGVYCYVSSSETILLHLIEYSETKCAAKLISWDDSGFVVGDRNFQSRLKFSPYANANAIMAQLSDFIRRISEQLLIQEATTRAEVKSLSKKVATETKAVKIEEANQTQKKEAEGEQQQPSEQTQEQIKISPSIRKKQVTAMEKTLRNALFFGFPNLAIHPESLTTLVERYPDQSAVFSLLRKLADNANVPSKALHGAAQKTGWREIAQHINTGRDSRGRIYLRAAKQSQGSVEHSWDVLITWKKDKKEQDRTIVRLGNLSPFADTRSILN